jgi:hypothetical protein
MSQREVQDYHNQYVFKKNKLKIIEGNGGTCLSKSLEVRVYIETGDPLRENPFLCLEGDPNNVGVFCAENRLHLLVALCPSSMWYQSCYLYTIKQ